MNKKLKILSFIAILIYTYIIVDVIVFDFIRGVEEGYSRVEQTEVEISLPHIEIIPVGNLYPEGINNLKTSIVIPYRKDVASFIFQSNAEIPKWITTLRVIQWIITLPTLIILCIFPVIFYKLLHSISKNKIFEKRNARYIRNIGIYMIIISCFETYFKVSDSIIASHLIQLDQYEISFSNAIESTWLIVGVVILIIAEIFNMGIKMKEDQDLTV